MNQPSKQDNRRRELLPHIVSAFVEKGYHRTTTAELARRCQVQETVLYRLWLDKKGMFIDGNVVSEAKPAPDVFLKGAKALNLAPESCVVFEDAEAGVEAAHRAQMKVIGVGVRRPCQRQTSMSPVWATYSTRTPAVVSNLTILNHSIPIKSI